MKNLYSSTIQIKNTGNKAIRESDIVAFIVLISG